MPRSFSFGARFHVAATTTAVLACLFSCGGDAVVSGPEAPPASPGTSSEAPAGETTSPPGPDTPAPAPAWDPCAAFPSFCRSVPAGAPATLGAPLQIVPSGALPATLPLGISNNNLAAVFFEQRLWLAFRTASHHHPREDATIHVVSTPDLKAWRRETSIVTGEDLREPVLLVANGFLTLLYTEVEAAKTNFHPLGVLVRRRGQDGKWTDPARILGDGTLLWRAHPRPDGTFSATGYHIEGALDAMAVDRFWWRSRDGRAFSPFLADMPIMEHGGGSESDVAWQDDGSVVTVIRNEGGDDVGFGSKICRAPMNDLGKLTCAHDPRKFDSPLLFRHKKDTFLIGRRNVTETGNFDLGYADAVPRAAKLAAYTLAYWNAPKRCALWKIDPQALTASFVLDLPTRGDTCFATALPMNERQYMVLDYTSPLAGPDLSWRDGQNALTTIYAIPLTLP